MLMDLARLLFGATQALQIGKPTLRRRNPTAIILANGPSLSEQLKDVRARIQREPCDLWCVNGAALDSRYSELQPTHYVLADSAYWDDAISAELKPYVKDLVRSINERTRWPIVLHVPLVAIKSQLSRRITNPLVEIQAFNSTSLGQSSPAFLRHWAYRHRLGMPVCQNVLVPTLTLAVLAHYKNVLIFGADHSWHQHIRVEAGVLMLQDRHFYDATAKNVPFRKSDGSVWKVGEIFHAWSVVHRQYYDLQEFSRAQSVHIQNLTKGSFIDAFSTLTGGPSPAEKTDG